MVSKIGIVLNIVIKICPLCASCFSISKNDIRLACRYIHQVTRVFTFTVHVTIIIIHIRETIT